MPEPAGETVGPYDVSKAVAGTSVCTKRDLAPPALFVGEGSEYDDFVLG